jgi:excisionase family DNA binding protein
MSALDVTLGLPEDVVEVIAQRVAAILAEQLAAPVDTGYTDVDGAAEFLACGKSRIYTMVSTGRLPHHRDGSRLLFDRGELRDYVRSGGAKRP